MSIPLVHFIPFVSLSPEERTLVQRVYRVQKCTKLKVQVVYSDEGLLMMSEILTQLGEHASAGLFAHNGKGMFGEESTSPAQSVHSLLTEEELRLLRLREGKLALYSATRCAYRIGERVFLWRFIPRPFTWNNAVRFLELGHFLGGGDHDQGALVLLDWAMERGFVTDEQAMRVIRHYGDRVTKRRLDM